MQSDFTRGVEKKAIFRIVASNHQVIELTENHPVLLATAKSRQMVQARMIKVGDRLLTSDGEPVQVTKIDQRILAEHENFVYNVDTREIKSAGHVIAANGFLVGDLKWQERLSERESRMANLLTANKSN